MTTALIIGDIQRGITGAFPFARQVVPPLTSLLPRARAALDVRARRERLLEGKAGDAASRQRALAARETLQGADALQVVAQRGVGAAELGRSNSGDRY